MLNNFVFVSKLNALWHSLLIAYLLAFSSHSVAETWYHVELIVFEQLNTASNELPPIATVPKATFTPNTTNELMQPAANSTLLDSARRLNNSSRYQVHYHQSWKQPIKTKAGAKSIAINSAMIDGRIRLHKGTYLYATVDLQLNRPVMTNAGAGIMGQRLPYLKEARRVRSGQLHFFDHPQLGALLKLTKL